MLNYYEKLFDILYPFGSSKKEDLGLARNSPRFITNLVYIFYVTNLVLNSVTDEIHPYSVMEVGQSVRTSVKFCVLQGDYKTSALRKQKLVS